MFLVIDYITKIELNHREPMARWSLHKHKCLWGVGSKGQGSSLQKEVLHTYTLRLSYNIISILYIKIKKNK